MGIKLYEMEEYPWSRALMYLKSGKIDALFSTGKDERREAYVFYPEEPLFKSKWVVFIRKEREKR